MTRILKIFEKAWLVAIFALIIAALVNLVMDTTFDHRIYFPLIMSACCALVFYNIRSQRRFMEKRAKEADQS